MLLYRLILTALAPALFVAVLLRVARGKERFSDLGQRLGIGQGTPGAIWLHGASNGELNSVRPLLTKIVELRPKQAIVVTANTTSGRDLVDSWGMPGVIARLAPIDLRLTLWLFRTRWQPALLIILENELWPNRILTSRAPVICIGARLSEKSAATWAKFPKLARRILSGIAFFSAQDPGSAKRFRALGLPSDRMGPVLSLKPDVILAAPDTDDLARLRPYFARENTVLAASTHEGEEDVILAAFAAACRQRPALKLILAPRHPRRAQAVAELVRKSGLTLATRTAAEPPSAQVYLADTLGEMSLWYALAGITFVAGTLTDRGGHTPFEPAQADSAIIHGPDVANFRHAYAQLAQANAAIEISDSASLSAAILALSSAAEQADLASRSRGALLGQKTDLTPLLTAIQGLLR